MKNGNFYASEGPEIYELWIEDGEMHIKTSDAQKIIFSSDIRRSGRFQAPEGEYINEATYKVDPKCKYVRVTVVGPTGKTASTNAYYIEDILD